MALVEFKVIVLAVKVTTVIYESMDHSDYQNWDQEADSRKKTIINKRLRRPRINHAVMPIELWKEMFNIPNNVDIEVGTIKSMFVESGEKSK